MNKKIALSVEQMKHLQELGLNINDASLYYHFFQDGDDSLYHLCVNEGNIKDKPNSERCLPAYTLQDLIEMIPVYIDECNHILCIQPEDSDYKWCIGYGYTGNFFLNNAKFESSVDNLIDAAYELLCWCIENKYIDM